MQQSPICRHRGIRSPEDVATYRRWCRGLFILYGAAGLILATAWGAHHLLDHGDAAQIPGPAPPEPVHEAGHGERMP